MDFQIKDPVVKRWLNILVVVFLGVLMFPGLAAAFLALRVVFPGNAESEFAIRIERLVHPGSTPTDIAKIILASIPALLGAIAFRRTRAGQLTKSGRWSLLVLLIGGVIALTAVFYLDPANPMQASRLTEGAMGIQHLRNGAEASLRYALTYGLLLLGLQAQVKS